MDIGEQSVDHLNKHIDEGFSEIMANYVVDYVQWLEEDGDVYIAYAPMLNTNVIAQTEKPSCPLVLLILLMPVVPGRFKSTPAFHSLR